MCRRSPRQRGTAMPTRRISSGGCPRRAAGSTRQRRRAVPGREEAVAAERSPFAYSVIRVVPRVEREEFVNVGVVLFSRPRKFLGVRTWIDADRLRALWPDIDVDAVARQLDVIRLVAGGDPAGGAIAS